MFLSLLRFLGTFSRQPFDGVGIVCRPRGDDDEGQDEGGCTEEDKSGLQGLEGETNQERED